MVEDLALVAIGFVAGFFVCLGVALPTILEWKPRSTTKAPRKPFDWSLFKKADPELQSVSSGSLPRIKASWRHRRRDLERSHNISHQQRAGFSPKGD